MFATFVIVGRRESKLIKAKKGSIWGTMPSSTPYDSRIHLNSNMSSALIGVAEEDGKQGTTTECEARAWMAGDEQSQVIKTFRMPQESRMP